jgi:predicted sugar kinase
MIWTAESLERYAERHITRADGNVVVMAHARAHFGAIDLSTLDPLGGGFGFGIPELTFEVTTRKAVNNEIGSLSRFVDLRVIRELADRMDIPNDDIDWDVDGTVLQHKGFGSTTQLIVSALQGLLAYRGRPPASVLELATVGVGAYSSIGVRLALDPTPVIDLGRDRTARRTAPGYPHRRPLPGAIRLNFPETWTAHVLWPLNISGMTDSYEAQFWKQRLPLHPSRTADAARAILLDLVAGICANSISTFINGLVELNRSGAKPEEWDIQATSVKNLAKTLRANGFEPMLTSVGPGMVVFSESSEADALIGSILGELEDEWSMVSTVPGTKDDMS